MSRHAGLALIAFITSSGAFADEPYVSIPSGMTQTLALQDNGSYSVRVGAITRDGGPSFSQLDFQKFDLQFKDGRSAQLLDRFEVNRDAVVPSRGDGLVIAATSTPKELLPGNYVLVVNVVPRTGKGKPQALTFTLAKPAPSISTGGAVRIERTSWWFHDLETVPGKLRLNEDSRIANLSTLSFAWDLDLKPGVSAPPGKLVLPNNHSRLDAGTSQVYPVAIDGDFAPGTYTGKITVRSPQLPSPVTVNFELLSRRDPLWLVALASLGAALGLLVRVVLKRRKELAEASISASLAVQKLRLAHSRIEEPQTREKIAEQLELLNTRQEIGKAAEITAAATAALTALQDIESKFKTERTAFQARIDEFNHLVTMSWILPPALRDSFASVTAEHGQISSAFARNNLTEAGQRLDDVTRGALLQAVTQGMRWRRLLADYLAAIEAPRPPLGEDARQKLLVAVEGARARLAADAHPASIEVKVAEIDLTSTHGAYTGGKDFINGLIMAFGAFLANARRTLADALAADSPEWRAIDEATRAVQASLGAALDAPLDAEVASATEKVAALNKAWRALLSSKLATDQFATINALATAGSWDSAIANSAEFLRPIANFEAAIDELESAAEGEPGTKDRQESEKFSAANLDHRPLSRAQALTSESNILTGSAEERRMLVRSGALIEVAQTVIVGVLFVAGVYALNADTWIGTLKEMLAIGILAFGVDLSAEGLIAVLKKS